MIVYLHGFNSTGEKSGKYDELTKGLPDIEVCAPTYPSNDPDEAIRIITELVFSKELSEREDLMFVGTSMGGYFAQYFARRFDAKCVLINPALEPTKTLQNYLGENTNYYTGEKYTLTQENIDAFKHYSIDNYYHEFGTLLLMDKGDELIDYTVAADLYHGKADRIFYEGGNHRFEHMKEAIPIIKLYYNSIWA